jgi:hypothetical protein
MLNTKQIVDYLQQELDDLKKELDDFQVKYDNAGHDDKIGWALRKDKLEYQYYHFWMVCNDLGIAPRV